MKETVSGCFFWTQCIITIFYYCSFYLFVVGHVTIRLAISHFLLMVLWNRALISSCFRDILLCGVMSLTFGVMWRHRSAVSFCVFVESCTPFYCVFDLVNTRSPKSSPNESPRASPIPRRRLSKVSFSDCDEIYHTAMLKTQNGHVVWDEKFEM